MQILVTGATGFVGSALCERLQRDGHEVVALVRARRPLPSTVEQVELPPADVPGGALELALGSADAIAHLAGEPIFGKRWTEERKRALVESRVGLAQRLVVALARLARKPRVLVSASAIGFYGDRGSEVLREDAAPGNDFLAQLCVDWERAAGAATSQGLRVASLRTGIVLGPSGGALRPLRRLFALGLGGRLGNGRQYMSWIHRDDLVALYALALSDARVSGAWNATAPQPVTNAEFTRALASALGRPALLPAPAFALRAVLGDAASVLLGSQRVVPARFEEHGFRFAHPELREALDDALAAGR